MHYTEKQHAAISGADGVQHVCLINLWTDLVPILQILTCTHCTSKSFTLLRLFGAVMFVFSRGEKDRKGADCQSRRDCMSCDAFSQEDGCTLSGGVQWCRHTLHACSYGETLDPFTLSEVVVYNFLKLPLIDKIWHCFCFLNLYLLCYYSRQMKPTILALHPPSRVTSLWTKFWKWPKNLDHT